MCALQAELKKDSAAWYLPVSESPAAYAILRFFTYFIIAKDFVPISLYVSLEMVRLCARCATR